MVKSLLPPKRHKIQEMKDQRTLKMYNNLVKRVKVHRSKQSLKLMMTAKH
ncbi:UNVERIFIED_ORG: hypothetical protein [Escherichia phage CMSTMSU]